MAAFELESPRPTVSESRGQVLLRFLDQRQRPPSRILLGKRDKMAVGPTPCGSPRLAMQHQRQQSLHFGLAGYQLQKHARQPDRFFRKIAATLVCARKLIPTDTERGINRFEYGFEPASKELHVPHIRQAGHVHPRRTRPPCHRAWPSKVGEVNIHVGTDDKVELLGGLTTVEPPWGFGGVQFHTENPSASVVPSWFLAQTGLA
jgi:hypothetical protein